MYQVSTNSEAGRWLFEELQMKVVFIKKIWEANAAKERTIRAPALH
jgi:hypothetical protein